jgi:peptidoglycan/LPS O-acetylase OafA/YrhL
MGQSHNVNHRGGYIPSLEGIRGYGFLLVFYGHYFLPIQVANPGTLRFRFAISISSLALFAVPAFFVLSGYLIGGILYDTRNREGFFRVFYGRRILRVFPIYYLTLLGIFTFYKFSGFVPHFRFWAHFFYIQNLLPDYTSSKEGPVSMIHFWSLAVEEQFYLLWPIVVWFFPDRQKLIKIATGIVACSCLLRCLAPLVATAAKQFVYFTPTRVDAILLGVILALTRGTAGYRWLERAAKWILLSGVVTAVVLANWKGRGWAITFWGEEIIIPLTNIVGVAVVAAVLEPNSLFQRVCSVRWACWLGGLSYSAYVFHLTFAQFFCGVLGEKLDSYMSPHWAALVSGSLAFCATILLCLLCRVCVEGPMMKLKRHLRYGADCPVEIRPHVAAPVLARTGT